VIEIEGADQNPSAVEDDGLGVQRCLFGREAERGGAGTGPRPLLHLVQFDAETRQFQPVARIAVMDDRGIGRGQRIGVQRQRHAARPRRREGGAARLRQHHVGRLDDDLAFGRRQKRQQPRLDAAAGRRRLRGKDRTGRGQTDQPFRPEKTVTDRVEPGGKRRPLDPARQRKGSRIERRRIGPERGGIDGRIRIGNGEIAHRHRLRIVPEGIEAGRDVGRQRSGDDDIAVKEIARRIEAEIGVADIAAADDRQRVVDRDDLVVHALVQAREVEDQFGVAQAVGPERAAEGIVETHLDIGMARDALQRRRPVMDVEAVDQGPHAHTARGRAQQRLADRPAAGIEIPDVILDVDAARRRLDGGQAQLIGIEPAFEKIEARPSGRRFRRRHQLRPERRLIGRGERARRRQAGHTHRRRTAGKTETDRNQKTGEFHRCPVRPALPGRSRRA